MQLLNSVFLPLIAGHLIADFWLQPGSWVSHKKENGWKSQKLILHSAIAAIIPVLFAFNLGLWWFAFVIFITHYLTDILKSQLKENIATFLLDQFLHIVVLLLLAHFFSVTAITESGKKFWIYAIGFILVTNPSGILIGMFLSAVIKTKSVSTKTDVSAWIGILERILILIFILVSQFSAIGFLIAAKSIFRFNEARENNNQKAEYFLLGTLVSFAFAIFIGLAILQIISA